MKLHRFRRHIGILAVLLAASIFGSSLFAQEAAYPSRRIALLVLAPAAGPNDLLGRLLADRLSKTLGQPVVVENRPGGTAISATEAVARQAPDGYTILQVPPSHVLNTSLMDKLPYDPIAGFEAVAHLVSTPFVLALNPTVAARSVKELVALARANPGKLTYATAGPASPHHLSGELFKAMSGVDLLHVPYKGAAQILLALATREVDMTFISVSQVRSLFAAEKLRGLAVTTANRTPLVPNLPTMAEAGGMAGYEVDVWIGALMTAGTPRPIVTRMNREMNQALGDAQLADKLTAAGLVPQNASPDAFLELMKSDNKRWSKLIKDLKLKME
ncbi:MAG: tripartite tricarboxylate transporter substrate binding protein [Betaproteobacteria bacterium]|nr:tripartite tricarboxylate transporter substrate binding protein [Betaproteobacteria bacterium]